MSSIHPSKYRVIITQRAFSSIIECVEFVNNVSESSSTTLKELMLNSIKTLNEFPNRYPEIENFLIRNKKVRKMPIDGGRYMVVYIVDADYVEICNVIDCRRNNTFIKIM